MANIFVKYCALNKNWTSRNIKHTNRRQFCMAGFMHSSIGISHIGECAWIESCTLIIGKWYIVWDYRIHQFTRCTIGFSALSRNDILHKINTSNIDFIKRPIKSNVFQPSTFWENYFFSRRKTNWYLFKQKNRIHNNSFNNIFVPPRRLLPVVNALGCHGGGAFPRRRLMGLGYLS